MSPSGVGVVSVEDAAEAYRRGLPDALSETDVSAFDRTGSAVWSVALLDRPGGNGVGYGPDVPTARASAFGELTEWYRSWVTLQVLPRVHASFAELGERAVDPRTLCLPAGSAWTPSTTSDWVTARRLRDGAELLVPVEFLASRPVDLPPGDRLVTVITNGLGAGLELDRAVRHGVLELLQRDGNGLVFRALDRGVVVDLTGLQDPAALQAIDRLHAAGVEPLVKLATTEFGLANVFAVGIDRSSGGEPISATSAGEAVDPDREKAVRKALLELCSSRARKAFAHGSLGRVRELAGSDYLDGYLSSLPSDAVEREEPRALAAMRDWLDLSRSELVSLLESSVLSQRSSVPLADLPSGEADPVELLHDEGFDVLVLDLSGDGVHAAKVVVPGLEVETMSYGRIGERGVRKALDLGLPFVRLGDDPGGWSPVLLTDEATERLGGPAWLDRAQVDATVGALYPLYREPARHLAQLSREVSR